MEIGRNQLCPCGSGKKYKKCCLVKDHIMSGGSIDQIMVWAGNSFEDDFEDFLFKMFMEPANVIENVTDYNLMLDSFIFDYKVKGKTLLENFIKKADLTPAEKEVYENFKNNIYGFFEVKEVKSSEGVLLIDIASGKEFWIIEKKGSKIVAIGDVLVGRIVLYNKAYVTISPAMISLPQEILYHLRRNKFDKERPNSMQILSVYFKPQDRIEDMNEREIKKELKIFFKKQGIKYDINRFGELSKLPFGYIQFLGDMEEFDLLPIDDYEFMFNHLKRLWDLNREKRLIGKKYNIGPKEKMIIETMLNEMGEEINKQKDLLMEEVKKTSIRFQEKWLNDPQKELDGRTPKEVILEERVKIGNPEKIVFYDIQERNIKMVKKNIKRVFKT